jgi:hypothetical protein
VGNLAVCHSSDVEEKIPFVAQLEGEVQCEIEIGERREEDEQGDRRLGGPRRG